jgi:hypothetical protein
MYDIMGIEYDTPPFYICFVEVGPRIGYRWQNDGRSSCEVNWLDPEPDSDSSGFGQYIEELQKINSKVNFYKGFHQPPTQQEYIALCEAYSSDEECD